MLSGDPVEHQERRRILNVVIGLALFLLGAGFVFFALREKPASIDARRVKLEAVSAACRLFAENNDMKVPDSLQQLEPFLKQDGPTREAFQWALREVDLVTPGMRMNADNDTGTIMIRERTPDRKGQRLVGRLDGVVTVDATQ
jgi:tellurite resistance protein